MGEVRLETGSRIGYELISAIAISLVKHMVCRTPGPSSAIGVTNIALHVGGAKSVRGVAVSGPPNPTN